MIKTELTLKGLQHVVRNFGFAVTVQDIAGKEKWTPYPQARWYLCAYLHAARPEWSLPRLAMTMGWKCHTTVLHALRCAQGYDGKGRKPALWTKEHFLKLALTDNKDGDNMRQMTAFERGVLRTNMHFRSSISLKDLAGRDYEYVKMRHFFCAYIRALEDRNAHPMQLLSYPQIGRKLNRHPSTIMSCVKQAHDIWGRKRFEGLAEQDWQGLTQLEDAA